MKATRLPQFEKEPTHQLEFERDEWDVLIMAAMRSKDDRIGRKLEPKTLDQWLIDHKPQAYNRDGSKRKPGDPVWYRFNTGLNGVKSIIETLTEYESWAPYDADEEGSELMKASRLRFGTYAGQLAVSVESELAVAEIPPQGIQDLETLNEILSISISNDHPQ